MCGVHNGSYTAPMPRKYAYSHGHAPAVVGHHALRTAQDSAAFLVPRLKSGQTLLDVGCGPGSITADLAELVHPGQVLAIDVSETAVDNARATVRDRELDNVEVEVASVYELGEQTFDVVYAHQVLQHLSDPVAALRRMRTALAPGGIVAVRDSDYAGMFWAPRPPQLDRWVELYHQMNEALGLESRAGRWLPTWVAEAGLSNPTITSSTWTHATAAARAVWAGAWERRSLESSYAEHALELGLAGRAELEEISAAFRWWAGQPNAIWVVPHVEVIAE